MGVVHCIALPEGHWLPYGLKDWRWGLDGKPMWRGSMGLQSRCVDGACLIRMKRCGFAAGCGHGVSGGGERDAYSFLFSRLQWMNSREEEGSLPDENVM